MARLHAVADAAGRDRSSIEVSVFGAPPEGGFLQRCAEAGVDRALFMLPSEGRDQTLARLDNLKALQS